MRELAIREHLKLLLRLRKNWDWHIQYSQGHFSGKVRLVTWGKELVLTKKSLETHIERTKLNLGRARELRQIRRQENCMR